MKKVFLSRLLTGVLVLALGTSFVACKDKEVKPETEVKRKKEIFPKAIPEPMSPEDDIPPPKVKSS